MLRVVNRSFALGVAIGIFCTLAAILLLKKDNYTLSQTSCEKIRGEPLMHGLLSPERSDAEVIAYVEEALSKVFAMGRYENRLVEARSHFTCEGFNDFMRSLKKMRVLEGLKVQDYTISLIPVEPMAIFAQGVEQHRYNWIIQGLYEMKYSPDQDKIERHRVKFIITVIRSRESDLEASISIDAFKIVKN